MTRDEYIPTENFLLACAVDIASGCENICLVGESAILYYIQSNGGETGRRYSKVQVVSNNEEDLLAGIGSWKLDVLYKNNELPDDREDEYIDINETTPKKLGKNKKTYTFELTKNNVQIGVVECTVLLGRHDIYIKDKQFITGKADGVYWTGLPVQVEKLSCLMGELISQCSSDRIEAYKFGAMDIAYLLKCCNIPAEEKNEYKEMAKRLLSAGDLNWGQLVYDDYYSLDKSVPNIMRANRTFSNVTEAQLHEDIRNNANEFITKLYGLAMADKISTPAGGPVPADELIHGDLWRVKKA